VAALGSQRQKIDEEQILQLLLRCQEILSQSVLEQTLPNHTLISQVLIEIQDLTAQEQLSEKYTLVLKQISLLLETLPELLMLKDKLLEQEIT
jgi:hypothetical protein